MRARASTLALEPGAWTVVWVVGRPARLPATAADALDLRASPELHVTRIPIVIEDG